MTRLAPDVLDRLVKLCGLFSSHHDGERAVAAAKADALIRAHNLVWADVITPREPIAQPGPARRPRRRKDYAPSWRETVQFAARHLDLLNDWECEFIRNLMNVTYPPSEKQRAIIDRLAAKVRATRRRAA